MILTCPACSAKFAINPKAIGEKGRTVRCGKCKHTWFEAAPDVKAEPDVQPAEQRLRPIPENSGLPTVKKKENTRPLIYTTIGFTCFAIILTVLLSIVETDTSLGFALADIEYGQVSVQANKKGVYAVRGKIINESSSEKEIPTLRISLKDAAGTTLQYWDLTNKNKMLSPGGKIPFAAERLENQFTLAEYFTVELGTDTELMFRE